MVFTRGLQPNGDWIADRQISVYGDEGGYIAFPGGHLLYQKGIGPTPERRMLISTTGAETINILETIDETARIFSDPPSPTGTVNGLPGIGMRE